MKKSKIALSFLLVISLFYSSNVYATTNFDNIESSENVILPSSIPTIDWKLLFNAVWEIGLRVENHFYTVDPLVARVDGAVGVSTGTMSLPDTNPAAYMTVKLRDNADTIYAFGKLGPLNTIAGNKVNIMITGPNGKDTVLADQRLQSDEGISIRYKAPGDYRVRFSPLTNKKWNFIVFYFFNQPPCTQCLPLEKQPAQLNDIAQDYYFNEKMFYTLPKQESFLKDSKNETGKRKGDSFKSINDLMNDSYDETLDDYVHSFKSYNIGDTITVSDKIADLVYDVETNITSVGFDYLDKTNSNLTDKVYWDFAGDLRNRFSTGDNILLNVKVVPINQENHLETLDILGFQSEDVPFIDDFLVSNLQKN